MEITSNYVLVDGIKTEDGRLIPIWDKEIVYVKNKEYDSDKSFVYLRSEPHILYKYFIKLYYDLVERKIVQPEMVAVYPDYNDFIKIGDNVGLLENHKTKSYIQCKFTNIEYKQYCDFIVFGDSEIIDRYRDFIHSKIDPKKVYLLRKWNPIFCFSKGQKLDNLSGIIKIRE